MQRHMFDHLRPRDRLAARILDRLDWWGSMSKRQLERRMNAWKHPLWTEAWEMLVARKCIRLRSVGRRKIIVTLVETPRELQARTVFDRTSKKPKRKRPPTTWFKQHLPEFLERDGYSEKAVWAAEELNTYGEEQDSYPVRPRLYVPGDPLAR
jgi:hypothetical protein